jgi:hypothetical protein
VKEISMFCKKLMSMACGLVMVSIMSCGGDVKDGVITDDIPLPVDTALNLYCEDVGIYPDACVLDDPENPFRMVGITENVYEEDEDGNKVLVSETNKFGLADECPSAKSLFYLWATALAKSPSGENQFNTADALHALYTEGGSENARVQAIKAYRAVLDSFFDSATFYEADWLPDEPVYAVALKDLVGDRLWDPSGANLEPLYDEPEFGAEALGEWGYALKVVLAFEYDDLGNIIDVVEKRIVNKIE